MMPKTVFEFVMIVMLLDFSRSRVKLSPVRNVPSNNQRREVFSVLPFRFTLRMFDVCHRTSHYLKVFPTIFTERFCIMLLKDFYHS